MQMEKFKLSQHIIIFPASDEKNDGIPNKYREDYFVLYNKIRDKEYLINPTIKYFIDKFSTPKSEAHVIHDVCADVKENRHDIEETCSSFFHFLCRKKILVPEELDETFALRETLYKPGDVIDDYTILEVLANKKYIDVYSATDNISGKKCVLKLLNKTKASEEDVYKQELFELEREYLLLKCVGHIPTMCKCHNFNKDEHNTYISLEYIDGKPLFNFIEETQGLTNAELLRIIHSILNAFAQLHKSDIIHGDIHSSNILVLQNKTIKIIDLGLSRTVQVESNEILPFGGVNYYMPPERINTNSVKKYAKEPDLYSDVYQVGLLVYLVLYNDLPFDGFLWEELSQNIKEGNAAYASNSFLGEEVPGWLIEIMKQCLHTNPEERYKNGSYILEDFKQHAFAEKETV